jgi:hypothetical protein
MALQKLIARCDTNWRIFLRNFALVAGGFYRTDTNGGRPVMI